MQGAQVEPHPVSGCSTEALVVEHSTLVFPIESLGHSHLIRQEVMRHELQEGSSVEE